MIYMSLMINSQTTEVRKVEPNAASNRLRRMRGKLPIKGHTRVTIVPKYFIVHMNGHGGWHNRLHWRRTHVRTYHRGEPNERKKVIARMLVGKRELGEVDHAYKIKTAELEKARQAK